MSIASTAWRLGLLGAVVAAVLGGVDTLTRTRIQANEQRVMSASLVDSHRRRAACEPAWRHRIRR